jgi:hypothetical protein
MTTTVARTSHPVSTRVAYLSLGLGLTAAAIGAAVHAGTGAWPVLLFAVLPDVALLAALGGSHAPGQLPRRAVPLYNLLHHPVAPLLLLGGAAAGVLGAYWVVAGLAWAAHLAVDRACGYGLRSRDGWQRG